jgi:hypothetical protein
VVALDDLRRLARPQRERRRARHDDGAADLLLGARLRFSVSPSIPFIVLNC